jgi:hypothetical protein
MIQGKLKIEIRGPNSLVIDETGQCWCLQMNDEQGIQKCYDYITEVSQLDLETA